MAPGEVGDESIIANGVGQAPDAFVAFVWAVLFAMRVCRAGLACDQRLVRLRQLKWGRAKSDFQGSFSCRRLVSAEDRPWVPWEYARNPPHVPIRDPPAVRDADAGSFPR
jgi:hypothetical protein